MLQLFAVQIWAYAFYFLSQFVRLGDNFQSAAVYLVTNDGG